MPVSMAAKQCPKVKDVVLFYVIALIDR